MRANSLKPRKALKKLNKAEALLSQIIDRLPKDSNGLGDLVASARATVLEAKKKVDSGMEDAGQKKPPARAEAPHAGRLSEEGRKRISLAAKRRWASARRKGINPVTGRRLKKSA